MHNKTRLKTLEIAVLILVLAAIGCIGVKYLIKRNGTSFTPTVVIAPRKSAAQITGLVGYWKFDEGTGSASADSSGMNHPATLNSGTSWTVGKIGNALQSDGVSGYASAGDIGNTNSQGMSVAFWVNFSQLPGSWKS